MATEILVPLAFFATVFGLVYVIISARNKERMALIDKGLDASLLHAKTTTHGRYDALKFGILLIGFAVGLFLGNVLESYTQIQEEVAYFSMIMLFGGIALILYYSLMRKIKPE